MTVDHAHQWRLRRWWAPPVAASLILLAIAVWGILAHQSRLPEAGPAPVLAQTAQPAGTPAIPAAAAAAGWAHRSGAQASAPAQAPATLPPMPAVLPVGADAVQIPSLQVSAPATAETVTDGALGVPGDPADVGWWMPSPAELVIDGHVDMAGAGPGALYEVRNLRPGAAVVVQTGNGPEHWTVDGVRTYRKGHVPAGLFSGQQTAARLVIVTCGGPFDYATHHYFDNVIAYASPSRASGVSSRSS